MRVTKASKSRWGSRPLAWLLAIATSSAVLPFHVAAEDGKSLRVCSDPNNLPFSNAAKAGFENRLAELVAADLEEPVTYAWHAQRRGFARETLNADECDVVMGVPKQLDSLTTTIPYYRSTYVFVSRRDRHVGIASIKDPRLRELKIGVQLIGDNGFNTPPAHAFAAQGMIDNIIGYPVYGDYRDANPAARIITAVAQGDIDVAAAWGPLAGFFAKQSHVPLQTTPITDTRTFAPLQFQFDIAMGVRKNDHEFGKKLSDIIIRKHPQITALLESYGVPLVEPPPDETSWTTTNRQTKGNQHVAANPNSAGSVALGRLPVRTGSRAEQQPQ